MRSKQIPLLSQSCIAQTENSPPLHFSRIMRARFSPITVGNIQIVAIHVSDLFSVGRPGSTMSEKVADAVNRADGEGQDGQRSLRIQPDGAGDQKLGSFR